ncbi:MAG: Stp1/IreP family PP2C-type Ser/Thr phosphatase [Oligoflexales bacterium]|nr:Stp1/IreP family PP2C-type Ser/Thr phosphatase [Oligoflexales bacterium]
MKQPEKKEFILKANGQTNVGKIRNTNQDSFLIDIEQKLFIVADGMGGHAGGEIASRLCVQEISKFLQKNDPVFKHSQKKDAVTYPQIASVMTNAVNYASSKIYENALEDPTLRGMGTTATVVKVSSDKAFCAHVGDSRLYLFRAGYIYQITHDHSLVSEQVRAGLLSEEEAASHHLRNVITRSVGYQEEEDVDTVSVDLEKDDFLLLCSDGLHGKVTDVEIAMSLKLHGLDATTELINLANDRGGEDNITVVIAKTQEE